MRMQLHMITVLFIVAISIVKSETSGCALVECPAMNGDYAILLPHPIDSGSYCICKWGSAIEMPCNRGLHFDPVAKTCSLPQVNKHKKDIVTNDCSSVTCSDCGLTVAHPTECNSYCKCVNGFAEYLQCPDGLYFNSILEVCDFKSHVQCNPVEIVPTGCEDVYCPAENNYVSLFLPNPKDCSSYCQCNWGTAIYMQCPPGLHYNADQQICDYPTEAQCIVNTQPSTESNGISNDVTTTENPITAFTTTQHQFNGCEHVLCPTINGEYALLLANPLDCGSFCMCNWGEAIYTPCSPGLHFHLEIQACDWPENAQCSETSLSPVNGAEPDNDIPRPPDIGDENDIIITGCENVTCPAPTGVYKLPNPIDCGSYCKCDNGAIFHVKCQNDHYFNPDLEMCDKPQLTNCTQKSSTTNLATMSTQFFTSESTITSTTVVILPISTQSTTVHLSSTSTDSIRSTETATNTETTETNSDSIETGTETIETSTEATTPDTEVTSDSNVRTSPISSTVSPADGCSLVNCAKYIESENAVHLSNPLDCGSFCKCDWGNAYYFSCPSGLHFNADLQICDWESNAGCNKSTLPAEAETTTIETTPIVIHTSTEPNVNGCEQVSCPALNGEFALHFPNPMDCISFCKCDWGFAVYFKCPEGLHFDPELQICNWPKYVRCELSPS